MDKLLYIKSTVEETINVLQSIAQDKQLCQLTVETVNLSVTAFRAGKKILLCGNGGSAADAQHWAGELVSRFYYDRPGLPAIALTTDTSILTAIGNDYGYDYSFARQIEALGNNGDVLFAISTSGNSKNVITAIKAAKNKGMKVIGFTGKNGGEMRDICDICICTPSDSTPKIQEGHEVIGHTICALIEKEMFPKD